MHSIRRILCAIKDPEVRATAALKKAAQLARGFGAQLELFHALTQPIYTDIGFEELKASLETRAVKRLQTIAAHLAKHGRPHLQTSVSAEWDTPSYEAVIRRAHTIKADLIVAERHYGPHLVPSLLHFNDWELLRNSSIPVLLVKRGGLYCHPVVLAAVDPTHGMDKPARLDAAILQASRAVSQALGATLHTVHAFTPILSHNYSARRLDPETAATLNRRIAAEEQRRYERLLNGYRIPKTRRHLIDLPPIDAISAVAARLHSDIVTLGAVSRSGWKRLLIGNTAEALLDPLTCDLLIVKPPHFKSRIPRKVTGPRYMPSVSMTA